MGEFDFDELDKAVNSLMTEHNKNAPAKDTPSQTINSAPETDNSHTQQPKPPSMASRRSIVPNRRGQFMDVMHPSKSAALKNEPRQIPTRKSVKLEPATMSVSETSNDPAIPSPGIDINPSSSEKNQSTEQKQSDWPDPLDMMQKHEENSKISEQNDATDIQPETSPQAGSVETEPSTFSAVDPMSSPFLPDAKVEKRPLGSPIDDNAAETAIQTESETEATDEINDFVEPSHEQLAATTDLPAEFHSEIMNIESRPSPIESSPAQTVQVDETDSQTPQANKNTVSDSENDQLSETTPESVAAPKEVLVSSLPPRQAEVSGQPEDDDIPDSSIFDNEASQSLKHPVKHSTGWFTVVIIGAMLLIGALGGVIYYYMANGY